MVRIPQFAWLAVLLFGPLPAQQEEAVVVVELSDLGSLQLGAPAPSPSWRRWERGDPVVWQQENSPPCSVFAFFGGSAECVERDADHLAELQQRFAARGVRVVAVVDEASAAKGLAACSIVEDEGQQTMVAWGITMESGPHIVAVDRAGKVMFQGDLGGGLVDAVLHTLDGTFDLDKALAAQQWRVQVEESLDDVVGATMRPTVDKLLEYSPRDGICWGIAYLIASTKLADAEMALAVRKRALSALANESRALAVFADLAMRGDPRLPGIGVELAASLQAATAAAPRDPIVQLAYLRALVVADQGKAIARQSAKCATLVQTHALLGLELAAILAGGRTPAVHRDVAQKAVVHAAELGAPERLLQATQWLVAARCAGNKAEADKLVDTYVEELGSRTALNNDCWYMMASLPTLGRFDLFAVALAERMLLERDQMDYFEFDTAALAMFLVGRHDEAVELQQTAIERGGNANPEYSERLERYRTAASR